MSKLVFNRDGGKTDEFGHLLALMRFMQGEVIEGLQVTANGTPNMSVNVPYGVAAIPTGSGATAYRYFVGLDATENVTIPTANGSNPRNDLIVLWVDKSVTPNQSVTNNSNNMLKISVVSGTPASTPADPNTAAIQAAIGASNPYIILARVVTGAGVTQINSGNITDLRSLTGVGRVLTSQILTAHINDLAVTTAKINDLAVTTAKLADAAVTGVKIGSYNAKRQNDTTNTTENTAKIQTGWGRITQGGGSAYGIETVTFPEAFTTVPIVIVVHGGDRSAAQGAGNYGQGGNNVHGQVFGAALEPTTTNFKAKIGATAGNYSNGDTTYYQWIAIGS